MVAVHNAKGIRKMALHSKIVGGSSAKRVINCPGSVALSQRMPPDIGSSYADEGTMLHTAISLILDNDGDVSYDDDLAHLEYNGQCMTPELYEEKIMPALAALDEIDPDKDMIYDVETVVNFGSYMTDVFGSADLIGKLGNRTIILDWKFGNGVSVDAEENEQGMFYAAAAMRTPSLSWAFENTTEIEIIIVQPPHVKRWVTTKKRIKQFERKLKTAVKIAAMPNATIRAGEHCKWCKAKPICPVQTGLIDRTTRVSVEALDANAIAGYLDRADAIESFIKELRALAHTMLENGKALPGYKLVQKRAVRRWADEGQASTFLADTGVDAYEQKLISPAQAEKLLKKHKIELPVELVSAVSSGTTLVPASDARPEALQIGMALKNAMSKLS